ncbi:MAG TPA: hydroxymethylglutaryl-CoA reductase [Solirubrobacterales bacterium]|nr:hydroxymethylglutaryl-CoA reductase [Solirubrobacterales bacterium]HMX71488.1 hydroxymethylglutaryl-CoA reductase [Solirubrobacterales bacterium]HMY26370.1 hydroxymethylglutaryl-CoA reductase [Solirubrobacterales bacterium]HNA24147.1 hydroxymethylglutaryl-CoA reductase [Solirubrobacterales bacterium]HNA44074.1 hydroxymethylglutaryl-CoA reductase [Solirubrobacterales bacterium]
MSLPRIPRDPENDYSREAAEARRDLVREQTGAELEHVGSYSFDPAVLPGNIENFIGVAQMPVGLAGPLLIDGEHAQGEFYVPMATTEGTLVASYSRGMKMVAEAGGVKTTIVDDRMQRAPAFIFDSAREAKEFNLWFSEHYDEIKAAAESTTSTGKLIEVERYHASRFLYTRFDYTTGDAAGQNMVSKATWAACEWIKAHYPPLMDYMLDAQLSTDKKHSQINTLKTRGKRVIAEVQIPSAILEKHMRVTSRQVFQARQISNQGAMLSGSTANTPHPANGIAAVFIATGQDEANVAESQAAIGYTELRGEDADYYYSITLPALIVATYGGGTALPTQSECLKVLGCDGPGKVNKLAEIIAATVLCGDLSLGSAVVADEWVEAHDELGRNR